MHTTRQKRPDRVICKWGKFTVEVFENNKQKDFDLSESFTHGNNGGVKTSYLDMGDNSTAKVATNTPFTKPNNEWEKEFDEEFKSLANEYCDPTNDVKDFISKTLQQQREEIIKEIEGIVGEDEKYDVGFYSTGCAETLIIQIRNQFRKEIRERLKQI